MPEDTPQVDYDALSKDKDFLGMKLDQQRAYLSAVDKDFAGLDPESQKGYISHLTGANAQAGEASAFSRAVTNLPEGQLRLRQDTGLPPTATQKQVEDEYGAQSRAMIGSTLALLGTRGQAAAVPGVGGVLLRAAIGGGASGTGALVGGATPDEAAGYALGGAAAQPLSEGLSAATLKLLAPKTGVSAAGTSVWENIWNRLTGKAAYAEELATAKNANLAKYRLTEQNAATAIDEANAKVAEARAALPKGEAGQWADLNTAVGVTPRGIRIGKGVSDLGATYGNAGRGLLREGFDSQTLSKLTPPEQAQMIGPKWQAAGKAVQDAADKATSDGVTLDAGKSVTQVIKNRIADPTLQEKAIDLINQHQKDLGIANMREATPEQALALRQALRNEANFGINATTDSMKGIGRALYSAVSNDLHDAVPAMKAVDQHYGDLAEAVNAVQKQTQRYAAGQWKPPQTQVEKAQAKVPEMPNVSPYKPLPAPPSAWDVAYSRIKNLAPWLLGGGGIAEAHRLLSDRR